MKRMNIAVAVVALATSLGVVTAAQAEDTNVDLSKKVYARLDAGMVIPADVDISSGTVDGITTTGSGTVEFESGWTGSAGLGYRFNQYFSAEAELGLSSFDYDNISGNGTVSDGTTTVTISGSADLDGSVDVFSGQVAGMLTPVGKGKVSPFIGAGVGFARWDTKINSIGGTAVSGAKDSGTDLLISGIAGLDYNFSDKLAAGLKYRYVWTDTGDDIFEDMAAHTITAGLTFRF